MANLARRQNTFNELFDLRSSFDHLFNRSLIIQRAPMTNLQD